MLAAAEAVDIFTVKAQDQEEMVAVEPEEVTAVRDKQDQTAKAAEPAEVAVTAAEAALEDQEESY